MTGSFHLSRGEVHGWCVPLDVPLEISAGLHATLTADEQRRSARLRFERDRRHFIVAHGALRELLGCYLDTHPGRIRFTCNAFGKPALIPEYGGWLKFNLSHSAGCAVIAVAAGAEVGVDVEYVRVLPDHADIARRFFSPAEVDHLTRLPSQLQTEAFFRCWTRMEALGKARGEGLEVFDGAPNGFAPPSPPGWSLYTIEPAPGYIGALVVQGSGWRLRECWWSPAVPRFHSTRLLQRFVARRLHAVNGPG